jgi:outer membrane protein insertion porin family
VDVIVNLEEQSTASIQFGVTFSGVTDVDTFPLSVFLQWEDKNFLGNGQTLSTNLTASPDTQSISLGFSENWFLGSPLTVSFELAYSHKSFLPTRIFFSPSAFRILF